MSITRPDRVNQPIFYVYVYWIDGAPFYVGKGHGNRARSHFNPNRRDGKTIMSRKMAKLIRAGRRRDIKVTFFIQNVDEAMAHFWEGFLIRSLGRRCDHTGPLCNLTWGGDRTNTGYRHNEKRRHRIREASRARWRDPKARASILAGMATCSYSNYSQGLQKARQRRYELALERVRRLQAGIIQWVPTGKKWVIMFKPPAVPGVATKQRYIGTFRTRVEAERIRVMTCRAFNEGRLDAFISGLRQSFQQQQCDAQKQASELKRYQKQFDWCFKNLVWFLKRQLDAYYRRANAASALQIKPWLVQSPYCVFLMLTDGVVQYVGAGRPQRIYRLLRRKGDNGRLEEWVQSQTNLHIHVLFLETWDQAKTWRSVWTKEYSPLNPHHRPVTQ